MTKDGRTFEEGDVVKKREMDLGECSFIDEFDGWLEDCPVFVDINERENLSIIEAKVVTSSEDGREAFEMLQGLSLKGAVRFKIKECTGRLYLVLVVNHLKSIDDTDADRSLIADDYHIGELPDALRLMVATQNNWDWFAKRVKILGYAMGISLLGKEVDKARVMGAADDGDFEELTTGEFRWLIDSMQQTMDREVYVVKIRLMLTAERRK